MSGKADQLGGSRSFGTAATAISSRRNAIEKTLNGRGAADAALTDLPVTLISDNPDNPRNHLRNLDETVESVRELGVILPIVVATTDAYLRDRPGRSSDIDDGAQYIVVDGHRRLEAARRAGLAKIPVRVDNGRVATDEALLEAAFVANYHRDDMTDMEEATALQSLVDFYGSQTKAAKRLGIPQSVISSKLSLLKLAPDLQADLMTGKRTVEHVRNLGKLSPEEQRQKADERAAAAEARRAVHHTPSPETEPSPANEPEVEERSSSPADYHGVIITGQAEPETPTAAADEEAGQPNREPVEEGRHSGASAVESVPEPRTGASPSTPGGKKFPYDNPGEAAMLLAHRMNDDLYFATLDFMVRAADKRDAARLDQLLKSARSKGVS